MNVLAIGCHPETIRRYLARISEKINAVYNMPKRSDGRRFVRK